MGYNTTYTLELFTKQGKPIQPDLAEEIIAELRKECINAHDYLEADGQSTYSEGSWRTEAEDMQKFSKARPYILFVLRGSGEEKDPPDLWKKYFYGGKMQEERAKMSIAPFDPAKLL